MSKDLSMDLIKHSVYHSEKVLIGEINPNVPRLIFNKDQMKALNEIFAAFPHDNVKLAPTKKDLVNTGIRLAIHHLNNYIEVE